VKKFILYLHTVEKRLKPVRSEFQSFSIFYTEKHKIVISQFYKILKCSLVCALRPKIMILLLNCKFLHPLQDGTLFFKYLLSSMKEQMRNRTHRSKLEKSFKMVY
jgi:hypothetical protein